MTHLDLFSGIGGFALAARWAGIETVQFVENEEFAQKVLTKNFPGVPIHGDIKTYRANGIVSPFLLTGGYPCQPFSQAGRRRGQNDDRHLWSEMFRVIQECRPNWVLAENVTGHIKLGLQEVLADLEGEGYQSQVFHIGALAKDAPHRRMRVWIVANSESERGQCWKTRDKGINTQCGEEISGWSSSGDVANSKSKRVEGCGTGGEQESHTHGQEGLSMCESERPGAAERVTQPGLGGTLSDGISTWMDEPDIPRVGVKIPDRAKRLKAIGNAIVPAVAYEIIRHMKEVT